MTTFIDNDTKILLLPLPESKRPVKIQDTKYTFSNYGDILDRSELLQKSFKETQTRNVRFEDKTSEEISSDIKKKRRVQMTKLNQIRTYQFLGMAGLAFGYLFVYRRFFAAKSVMNSAIYHQTLNFIKTNEKVLGTLGQHLQIMNCNGKIHPLKSTVNFELVIFGSNQRGKLCVSTEYNKATSHWKINGIEMFTRNDRINVI